MKASLSRALLSLVMLRALSVPIPLQAQGIIEPTGEPTSGPVWDSGILGWVVGAGYAAVELKGTFLGNTKRSCTASYRLTVLDSHDAIDTFETGMFASIGGCGKTVPDRCRRRARDRAHECMKAHWDRKSDAYYPAACNHSEDAIYNYAVSNLESYLNASVCKVRSAGTYSVRVEALTRGKSGCGNTQILANTFQVSCL